MNYMIIFEIKVVAHGGALFNRVIWSDFKVDHNSFAHFFPSRINVLLVARCNSHLISCFLHLLGYVFLLLGVLAYIYLKY